MELGPGGSSGRFETGVLHRISIPFRWAEWFGLGSHFWENTQISRKCTFSKICMSEKSRNVIFQKKKRRRPNVERSRKLLRILGYIYTGIYIYTSTKSKTCLLWIYTFLHKSQKSIFPQIRFFGNVFPYLGDVLLKTKMVRTVHRNILYSVDLKIRDSKRWFGTKSQKWLFQKWGLENRKFEFGSSKWNLWGRFQRQKYSKIYPGPIPRHPGSIFIYKKLISKKNLQKSIKINENPSLLSPLGGLLLLFHFIFSILFPKKVEIAWNLQVKVKFLLKT